MPTMPIVKATSGRFNAAGMINSMINDPLNPNLHTLYRPDEPNFVQNTTASIRAIGEVITAYIPMMNEVHNALVNRIGLARMEYMMFQNPWMFAYRGKLEMGETVEEIFVGESEVFPFDVEESETNFAKRAPSAVSTAFHSINYHEVYKVTVDYQRLKKAFLSVNGLDDYVDYLMGTPQRSATADEFMCMKYLIATLLLDGKIKTFQIEPITADTAANAVTQVTETTNLFQFPSREYTMAGNKNTVPLDNLYILESAKANAQIKVNSLATAFNIDEVKFMGHVVMFDSLGTYDWSRMAKLFAKDKGYKEFTAEEIALLNTVDFICMHERFMQFYDNFTYMATPFINGEGLYTNYPYHVSKVMSASPFQNCIAFTTTASSVTGVTVSPEEATVTPGAQVVLTADVETTGFARSEIVWSIDEATEPTDSNTYVGQDGILRVGSNETAGTINVIVTSTEDPTKTATAVITVS